MRGFMEILRHPFGTPGVESLGLPVEPSPALSPRLIPASPQTAPVATRCKVEFDGEGKVLSINVPQGRWAFKQKGQNRYYTQDAHSLLQATEILKKLDSIPGLTYYTVDTPDGPLGRDIQGFFTEAPLKTGNLTLETACDKSGPVEFVNLQGFGEMLKNQTTVALLKKTGEYARLVLLMKCGRCGYESPIETEAGSLVRQCYCCGAENRGHRGNVTMDLDVGSVKI